MNSNSSHVAIVLLPFLAAACDASRAPGGEDAAWLAAVLDEPGEGGAGGGGGEAATAGEGGSTTSSEGGSTTNGEGGSTTAGGGGSTAAGEGGSIGEGGSSGETATTGAGGGLVMSAASDTCLGQSLGHLDLGAAATVFDGTTAGATDAVDSCWSAQADDGADRVFAYYMPAGGVLNVTLEGKNGFKPTLSVRTTCVTEEYCHQTGAAKQVHRSERGAESVVYVVVDGPGAATGEFTLTAQATAPACGDGLVTGDEECDGGGASKNDGCGDPGVAGACTLETPAGGAESCADIDGYGLPGERVVVPAGVSAVTGLEKTTNGFEDDAKGSCMPEFGGADRVFRLDPVVTGSLQIRAGMDDAGQNFLCSSDPGSAGCFDIELYARSTCADEGTELGCRSDCCDGETMTIPVVENVPVYLFVDGYDAEYYSHGPFNLHFTLTPAQ